MGALAQPAKLPAVDVLRGITIVWITLFHMFADTRGAPGPELRFSGWLSTLRSEGLGAGVEGAISAIVALPTIRVDLFLFVTGLVLMLRPELPARVFLWRRMRVVLPSYWLGSLLVFAVVILLAAIRTMVVGGEFGTQLREGSLLARLPYVFEWSDILRSLSVVGRFEDTRSMQVISPSMWYILLALQAYCLFPALRRTLARIGPFWFVLLMCAVTWIGRWLVFRYDPLPSFDPNSTVIHLLPFRLAALAAGMVAARWAAALRVVPRRSVSFGLAGPALLLVLAATWASDDLNKPGTVLGVIGPIAILIPSLPAMWILATAASVVPGLGRILIWSGRHSISILVAQDALRFVVGTAMTLGVAAGWMTWWITLPYLAATLVLAKVWAPLPAWFTKRFWPA